MILILLNQHEVLFSAYVLPVPLCVVDSASAYPDPHTYSIQRMRKKKHFFFCTNMSTHVNMSHMLISLLLALSIISMVTEFQFQYAFCLFL